MNNDNFLIESSDIELAQDLCKYINDPELRNRSVANSLAANIAGKYFEEVDIDIESGLHNVAAVLSNFEISDIYVKNAYIDVRLYFNENELCVPKAHFDNNILPVAYMFIKLDNDLSSGLVAGFITPSSIDTTVENNGYYGVKEEQLQSYYDIEPLLYVEPYDDIPENFEAQIFDYLDNRLEDVSTFYKILINSKEYRLLLINSAKTQLIFDFISTDNKIDSIENSDESLADESLGFIDNDAEDAVLDTIDADSEDLEIYEDSLEEISTDNNVAEEELIDYELLDSEETDDAISFESSAPDEIEELVFDNEGVEELSGIPATDEVFEAVMDYSPQEEYLENHTNILEEADSNLLEQADDEILTDNETANFDSGELSFDEIEEEPVVDEDFSTITTPSLEAYESETDLDVETDKEDISQETDNDSILDEITEDCSYEDAPEELDSAEMETSEVLETTNGANAELEVLFGEQNSEEETVADEYIKPLENNKKTSILPMLGILTIVAAAGYFGYTKYVNQNNAVSNVQPTPIQNVVDNRKTVNKEAMPIETVENIKPVGNTNEGNAVAIPEIESNLDASILVSNLSINWEVPTGYVNNPSAKRYFVKMGKIIQLNLKTELLLLSKPPITNRIAVELEFNKDNNRFKVKQFAASSGEKSIDDLIVKTVNNALDLSLSTNMSTFNNIQGNPILVIRL